VRKLSRQESRKAGKRTHVQRHAMSTVHQGETSGLLLPLHHLQRTIGNRAVGRLIQAKLEVSKTGDVYEQEADRVAEQVMRMPNPNAMNKAEIGKQRDDIQIQRACAKCEEELSRQVMNEEDDEAKMQTKEISGQTPELRPEIEDGVQALRGGGQPLPESVRAFFEPRFKQDFSQVRIHTDQRAAESARSVNALAYTVGRDVVFGSGQYSPETPAGQRLLAHELTHVVQQRGVDTDRLNQPAQRQAQTPSIQRQGRAPRPSHRFTAEGVNVVGASSLSRHGLPEAALSGDRPHISRDAGPALRRWSISGDTATSDREGDTLGALALSVGGRFNDWKCIKPISMRTFKSPGAAAKYGDRYERFIQIGDEFDVSNLTATSGTTFRIYLFDDSSEAKDAALAKLFYPGSVSSSSPDTDIEGAAGFGSTPIHEFLIFGHSGGDTMWGAAGSFKPADFDPEDPPPSFGQAERGFFPRRCWFTRQASARSVGCSSETWGRDFAAHYLRKGAKIVTTTASVRPKCKVAASGGGCTSYNGVDFATSSLPSATSLEGPFWSVSDFHDASHWSTIAGKL
jgi:Domain of unknown function (DUF4157)